MYPMLQRPKLKMSEFGVKQCLWVKKMPTKKMGGLIVAQIHLAQWTRLRVVKGLGADGL